LTEISYKAKTPVYIMTFIFKLWYVTSRPKYWLITLHARAASSALTASPRSIFSRVERDTFDSLDSCVMVSPASTLAYSNFVINKTPISKKDPTAENRAKIKAKIKEIQQQQVFRTQLRDLMLKGALDQGTQEFLTTELKQLEQREQEWNTKLIENEDVQKRSGR
jgi:hypothetical protein